MNLPGKQLTTHRLRLVRSDQYIHEGDTLALFHPILT